MENWDYFKVCNRIKPEVPKGQSFVSGIEFVIEQWGVIIRTDGRNQLEVFSGGMPGVRFKDTQEHIPFTYDDGILKYDSQKYSLQRMTKLEADQHREKHFRVMDNYTD